MGRIEKRTNSTCKSREQRYRKITKSQNDEKYKNASQIGIRIDLARWRIRRGSAVGYQKFNKPEHQIKHTNGLKNIVFEIVFLDIK